jgi:hypothetical protein
LASRQNGGHTVLSRLRFLLRLLLLLTVSARKSFDDFLGAFPDGFEGFVFTLEAPTFRFELVANHQE